MILSVNGPLQHGQHLHNPYFLGSQPKVMNFWLPHNCSNNCFVCLPSLNFHRLTLILNFPSHDFHSFLSFITSTHSVIHSILFLLHSSSHSSSSFHSFRPFNHAFIHLMEKPRLPPHHKHTLDIGWGRRSGWEIESSCTQPLSWSA